jgi:hypothetical protein
VAVPDFRGTESQGSPSNALMLFFAALLGIALLLLAAAAISPAHVPWPRVASGLYVHRDDLVLASFGAAGIAFVLFFLLLVGL